MYNQLLYYYVCSENFNSNDFESDLKAESLGK